MAREVLVGIVIAARDLGRDGQVVDGGEVPDLVDVVQARAVRGRQAQTGCRDVTDHEPHPSRGARVGDLELLDPGAGERAVLALHQAHRVGAGPAGQQAGEERRAEKAREPGHEQLPHVIRLFRRRCRLPRVFPGHVTGFATSHPTDPGPPEGQRASENTVGSPSRRVRSARPGRSRSPGRGPRRRPASRAAPRSRAPGPVRGSPPRRPTAG